jgi:hypothetical protein
VNGYVNAVPGFPDSPQVINGASDLLVEILGETGRHVRAAIGVSALPRNALVELQMTVELEIDVDLQMTLEVPDVVELPVDIPVKPSNGGT